MLVFKYYYFTTKQKKIFIVYFVVSWVFYDMFYIDAIVQGDTTKVGMVDN